MPPTPRTDVRAKFSKFFRRAGLDPFEKNYPGRRDLSVDQVSASSDLWRSKKREKMNSKNFRKIANFDWPFNYPPGMAPFGLKLGENAFQRIPDISFFDAELFFP